jgi:ABC-type Zn uptake system ZnuABC Zn-binding protein ZnuA
MVRSDFRFLGMITAIAVGLTACAASPTADTPALPVVAVADQPVADLVRRIGGDRINVEVLVPIGADSHTYEPTPSDAITVTEAAIYIESGGGLNQAVTALAFINLRESTRYVQLSESIPQQEIIYMESDEQLAAHGHGHESNAHFWPNPAYAALYAQRIADELIILDPAGEAEYRDRVESLLDELAGLDAAIATAVNTIPDANRLLVVYHDAWSYFGRQYDLPVVGAIQPADFSEPSAAEVRTIIEEINALGVPAFFGSEVFPSGVLDAVAESTNATYVADLSDDVLPGEAGTPEHSYIGMMLANARAIVDALGGDSSALDAVLAEA